MKSLMDSLLNPSGLGVFLVGRFLNYEFNFFSVHIRYLGFLLISCQFWQLVTFKEFVNIL